MVSASHIQKPRTKSVLSLSAWLSRLSVFPAHLVGRGKSTQMTLYRSLFIGKEGRRSRKTSCYLLLTRSERPDHFKEAQEI